MEGLEKDQQLLVSDESGKAEEIQGIENFDEDTK
jgi:hypothetical protein